MSLLPPPCFHISASKYILTILTGCYIRPNGVNISVRPDFRAPGLRPLVLRVLAWSPFYPEEFHWFSARVQRRKSIDMDCRVFCSDSRLGNSTGGTIFCPASSVKRLSRTRPPGVQQGGLFAPPTTVETLLIARWLYRLFAKTVENMYKVTNLY